jgi:hypothetical protein
MGGTIVLVTSRIRWLVANGLEFIILGTDNLAQVELLGNACGIFKKNRLKGTSLVLETLCSNNVGGAAVAVDEIL